MLALLLDILLGTACRVDRPDYTHVRRAYIAVAKVPFFVQPCATTPGPSIDVFAEASTRHKIAELRWGNVGNAGSSQYCEPLVFAPRQLCPRGTLPFMEDGYEERVLIVLRRRGRWVEVRLDRGTGWVHLTKNDEVVTYGDLVINRLAALTEDWDGRIYDTPGGAMHRRQTVDRQYVSVDDWREVHGRLWFKVRLLEQNPHETREPKVLAKGWIHAYSDKKDPTVAHFSRGC